MAVSKRGSGWIFNEVPQIPNHKRYMTRARRAKALRALTESLEDRQLMTVTLPDSVIPAATSNSHVFVTPLSTSGDTGSGGNSYSSPTVAVNPLDSFKLVEASVVDNTQDNGGISIDLRYSTNGGATWTAKNLPGNLVDPASSTGAAYTQATDPAVAFDRLGNFYLTYSEHTGDSADGAIVLQKYNFTTATPALDATVKNQVIYQWAGSPPTGSTLTSNGAFTPTLAVDSNVARFIDPTVTNPTASDVLSDPTIDPVTGQGPVYVAWVSNDKDPNPNGTPKWNPNVIKLVESTDGGATFTANPTIVEGTHVGDNRDADPRLVISQGVAGNTFTALPGQLTVLYDDVVGSNGNDIIHSARVVTAVAGIGDQTPIVDNDVTDIPLNITSPNGAAFNINSLTVQLALRHPDLSQLTVQLQSPSGQVITLADTMSGSDLGEYQGNNSGALFDDNASTSIDSAAAASAHYIGRFAPVGSLSTFNGQDATGTWHLLITDNVADADPSFPQIVDKAEIDVQGSLTAFDNTTVARTLVRGSVTGTSFPNASSTTNKVMPGIGFGPGAVIASDNTLGFFAGNQFTFPFPGTSGGHAGMLYVAYTGKQSNITEADNTDIYLMYSSDGGQTWQTDASGNTNTSVPGVVNDDNGQVDGFSGAQDANYGRGQFMPAIAVDQSTGTLVLTWYDARNDASRARVATYLASSIDGGNTFSSQTFLNRPNEVFDASTGQTVSLGPIPDNAATTGSTQDGAFEFGNQMGLAVVGGQVHAVWSGNENGGDTGKQTLGILTSQTTIADGPRVILSTTGVVSQAGDTLNPPTSSGPAFQYLDIYFDRPIDVASLTTSMVHVSYHSPGSSGVVPGSADLPLDSIAAINATDLFDGSFNVVAQEATHFRVKLLTPQTSAGTYTYTIDPGVSDGIRHTGVANTSTVTTVSSSASVSVPGNSAASSTITLNNVNAPNIGDTQRVVDLNVSVTIDGSNDPGAELFVFLQAPDGTTIPLVLGRYGPDQLAPPGQSIGNDTAIGGNGFESTTFDDQSSNPIRFGRFQFSGIYSPEEIAPASYGTGTLSQVLAFLNQGSVNQNTKASFSLASVNGMTGATAKGTWTLEVLDARTDSGTSKATIRNWSLSLTTADVVTDPNSAISGNAMDQNGDGISGEAAVANGSIGDVYAVPTGLPKQGGSNGIFISSPLNTSTLPVIVPGPHQLTEQTYSSGQSGAASGVGTTTTVIDTNATGTAWNTSNSWIGYILTFTSGVNAGRSTLVSGYDAGTHQLTFGALPSAAALGDTFTLSLPVPSTGVAGTTSADGNTTTAIDSFEFGAAWSTVDFWKGYTITFTSGANNGLSSTVSGYDPNTGTLSFDALPNATLTGDTYTLSAPVSSSTFAASTLTINTGNTELIKTVQVKLDLSSFISFGSTSDLVVTLIAPDGTPITLSNQEDFTSSTGQNIFSDSGQAFTQGFTNFAADDTFAPEVPLSLLEGKSIDGTWTLRVEDVNGNGLVGTLNSWSLMATTETVIVNPTGPTTTVHVTFDRDMKTSSISASSILRIMGPVGLIAQQNSLGRLIDSAGNDITNSVSIVADPNFGGDYSDAALGYGSRTFAITLPGQYLSGEYSVTLSSNIAAVGNFKLDNNQNAGLDALRGSASSTTVVKYTGGSATISLNNPAVSTIIIPDNFNLKNATVHLNITYPIDGQLAAILVAPDGTSIELFSQLGNTGTLKNFVNTVFDDSGANGAIQSAAAPYTGTFKPQQPLSALIDKNVNGTWKLIIESSGANSGSLNSWSIDFKEPVYTSGLGETSADQVTANFRIYNMAQSNGLAQSSWTAVGGASQANNLSSGQIGAISVDPSDPSGNTVYVAGASGGVWKTTNFLTSDSSGPTWIPLTDFGPSSGLNIGGLTVFGGKDSFGNLDTSKSVIIGATGFGDSNTAGVGFIISTDGGATWSLMDSTDNTLPLAQRDHKFVGTAAFKVVVDPNRNSQGNVIIYAALVDTTGGNKGGIWTSSDNGLHWTQVRAGDATDLVLDMNSAQTAGGNLQAMYAAFRGDGVYRSANRGTSWSQLLGGLGDPLIRDTGTTGANPVPVTSPASTPNGNKGRIVLAMPALTGDSVQNVLHEGWLYAAVVTDYSPVGGADETGTIDGLYMTKDFGQNWVKMPLPDEHETATVGPAIPSNDQNAPRTYSVTNGDLLAQGVGNYALTLAVDPNNPNVIYLGGSPRVSTGDIGLVRIDTTGVSDAHSFYLGNNGTGGAALRVDDQDVVTLSYGSHVVAGHTWGGNISASPDPMLNPAINLIADPNKPFLANSTVYVSFTNVFNNTGANIKWIPFDSFTALSTTTNGRNAQNLVTEDATAYHRILTMIDPLTGETRIIVGTDEGVFTAVDEGDGTLRSNTTNSEAPTGSRNGNLQIAQDYYGAVQPSDLAAQVAGARFYANTLGSGLTQSTGDELSTGNTNWSSSPLPGYGSGGVATDPQGLGNYYSFQNPFWSAVASDFFQVNGVGRTFGLLTSISGGDASTHDPQWVSSLVNNLFNGSNFAVNPLNGNQIIVSSHPGNGAAAIIFSTENQGQFWQPITGLVTTTVNGQTTSSSNLDGSSYYPALAFGAPDPAGPGAGEVQNYLIYAGSQNGNIFVTFHGGGTNANDWQNISVDANGASLLDGTAVESIVANPTQGSHEIYAVTQGGHVYHITYSYNANSNSATTVVVTDITANLQTITANIFNNSNLSQSLVTGLNAVVADWRYFLPNDVNDPTKGTHPVLYVGGNSGVFRSMDGGATWTAFPVGQTVRTLTANNITSSVSLLDPTTATSSDFVINAGGNIPHAVVTDLDLALGDIDPTTGQPILAGSEPMLVASTFGRGQFAIRLGATVSNAGLAHTVDNDTGFSQTDGITKNSTPIIVGDSAASQYDVDGNLIGNKYRVTLLDENGNIVGGYNPSDPSTDVVANWTDGQGHFSVQVNPSSFTDGVHTIYAEITDDSGLTSVGTPIYYELRTVSVPPTITSVADSALTVNVSKILAANVGVGDQFSITLAGSTSGTFTFTAATTSPLDVANGLLSQLTGKLSHVTATIEGNSLVLTPDVGSSITVTTSTTDGNSSDTQTLTVTTQNRAVGNFNPDGITNDLTLSGTSGAFSLIELFQSTDLNTIIGQARADASGNWTVTATNTANLPQGTFDIVAVAIDAAGNAPSSASAPFHVKFDNVATAALPVISPDSGPAIDPSSLPNPNYDYLTDRITNQALLTFSSDPTNSATKVEANSFVVLMDVTDANNPVQLGSAVQADINGNWTITLTTPLSEGTHKIIAQQYDVEGNVSPLSGTPVSVTIDLTNPISPQAPQLMPDTGQSNSDGIVDTGTPTFTGIVEPNAYVKLFDNTDPNNRVLVGSGYAHADGVYNITLNPASFPNGLPDGTYNIIAQQFDVAGNASIFTFGQPGAVIIDGTDDNDHGSADGSGNNLTGWLYMQDALTSIGANTTNGNKILVALDANPTQQAGLAIKSAFNKSGLPQLGWTYVEIHGSTELDAYLSGQSVIGTNFNGANATVSLSNTGVLFIDSVQNTAGDIDDYAGDSANPNDQFFGFDPTNTDLATINQHGIQIAGFVNSGGGLFAMGESPISSSSNAFGFFPNDPNPPVPAYGWLSSVVGPIGVVDVTSAGVGPFDIQLTATGAQDFPTLKASDLSQGPWHNYFTNIPGALSTLATDFAPDLATDPTGFTPSTTRAALLLTSGGASGTTIIVDTHTTNVPTISMGQDSDTHADPLVIPSVNLTDNVTSNRKPSFGGVVLKTDGVTPEVGALVTIYEDFGGSNTRVQLGTAITDSTGTWLWTPNFDIQDGAHTYVATAETVAGEIADPANQPTGGVGFIHFIEDNKVPTITTFTVDAFRGQLCHAIVGGYSDQFNPPLSNGYASINWGDGSSPTIEVIDSSKQEVNNPSLFDIDGLHTWNKSGDYTVTITAFDGAGNSSIATTTVHVTDPQVVDTQGVAFIATEGVASTGALATFQDPFAPQSNSSYTATIDWGDGTTTTGVNPTSAVVNGNTVFTISGTHTYAHVGTGTYPVSVTIVAGNGAPVVVNTTATVNENPVVVNGGLSFTASEGTASTTQLLATFTDPGGLEALSSYSVSVNWGDGSTSTITPTLNQTSGVFSVKGSHTYSTAGSYNIVTTVVHGGTSASNSTRPTIATISDAPLSLSMVPLVANEGSIISTKIAVLNDSNLLNTDPSEYNVSINWGDGSGSTPANLTFAGVSNGFAQFNVVGSHEYLDGPASYNLTLTVTSKHGSHINGGEQISVVNVAPTPLITSPVTRYQGNISFTIGASDPSDADRAAGFTYTVDWGDGSPKLTIPATANNSSGQTVTHVFATDASYNVVVTATDKDGATGTTTVTALGPQAANLDPVENLVINSGSSSRNTVNTLDFQLFTPSLPIASLSASDMVLYRNGSQVVDLSGAQITYNSTTGQVHMNLQSLGLGDGQYQLQIKQGAAGVIPINFAKLQGDVDGDGVVTSKDLKLIKANIGTSNLAYDINGDGVVDKNDYNLAKKLVNHRTAAITKSILLNPGKGLSKPSLNFGSVKLGQAVAPIDLVLGNVDPSQPLRIQDLKINANPGVFDVEIVGGVWGQKPSEFVIPAGQTITLRVYLNPVRSGSQSARLSFIYSKNDHSLFNFADLGLSAKIK